MDPNKHSMLYRFFIETDVAYLRKTEYLCFTKHGQNWELKFMRPRNSPFTLTLSAPFIKPGLVFNASGLVTLINQVDYTQNLFKEFSHTFSADRYSYILSSNFISVEDLLQKGFIVDKTIHLKLDATIVAVASALPSTIASALPPTIASSSTTIASSSTAPSNAVASSSTAANANSEVVSAIFDILQSFPNTVECTKDFLTDIFTKRETFANNYLDLFVKK